MADRDETQSEGRRENGAAPLGDPLNGADKEARRKTGEQARRSAGPDGPDARAVGDTFKRQP